MKEILRIKFSVPFLRAKLVATKNAYLEETNWWNDKFWGVTEEGVGSNTLGKLLMEIRSEFMSEDGLINEKNI